MPQIDSLERAADLLLQYGNVGRLVGTVSSLLAATPTQAQLDEARDQALRRVRLAHSILTRHYDARRYRISRDTLRRFREMIERDGLDFEQDGRTVHYAPDEIDVVVTDTELSVQLRDRTVTLLRTGVLNR